MFLKRSRYNCFPARKRLWYSECVVTSFYDIEYLFTVDEHRFNPPPKVKSGVIRLRRNSCQSLSCDEQNFKLVVKTAFNQRRKTLRNSLKTLMFNENFTKHPIFNKRPEQLSVEEFIMITKELININFSLISCRYIPVLFRKIGFLLFTFRFSIRYLQIYTLTFW